MKTFMKVVGVMMYAAGWSLMILAGVATILTVREHSDAIKKNEAEIKDLKDRMFRFDRIYTN